MTEKEGATSLFAPARPRPLTVSEVDLRKLIYAARSAFSLTHGETNLMPPGLP